MFKFNKSKTFGKKIAKLIPGGAHTYSRGADQFSLNAPNGLTHGKGAYVFDIDKNKFLDWGMALGSVSIGHAHPSTTNAVIKAIKKGVNFTRPTKLELDAAEIFLSQTGMDMVKFAKHGSSATTAAVKLARAYTGRSLVAVPKEQPFFSFDDWFISSTESDFGIPGEIKSYTLKFSYNDLDSLEDLFQKYSNRISCILLEPVKVDPPNEGFLQGVRELCSRNGAVLIFDEMVTGLKWPYPGAGSYFNVQPDLSTWGKGISNGFSCVALSGIEPIMKLGSIANNGQRKLFLLSTTHGAESTGLAAMIATMNEFKKNNYIETNWKNGAVLKSKLNNLFALRGLTNHLKVKGYPGLLYMETFDHNSQPNLEFRTLLIQEVIKRGLLWQGVFIFTPSHGQAEINRTLAVFEDALPAYIKALEQETTDRLLVGPAIKPVFRRYN